MEDDKIKKNRMENNKRLSEIVKTGGHLESFFDSHTSWFPPRPTIKKDKELVDRLYGEDKKPDLTIT